MRPLAAAVLNGLLYLRHPQNTRKYRLRVGRWPNYAAPRAYTEKLQWRKLFDRNQLFPVFCDKLAVRDFVAARAPSVRLPDVLWSGTAAAAIPYDALPDRYVIKSSRGSGHNYFVRSPGDADRGLIAATARRWLERPHGRATREWGYRDIVPRLFIETLLDADPDSAKRWEFRFHAFGGRVEAIAVPYAAFRGPQRVATNAVFYDRDWNRLPYRLSAYESEMPPVLPRPEGLDDLLTAAETLARGIDYVRVDLFGIRGQVWFGEMTIYPASGFMRAAAATAGFEERFGAAWRLPALSTATLYRRGLLG
jgi:hypothetical protein